MKYVAVVCPREQLSDLAESFLTNPLPAGTNWSVVERPTKGENGLMVVGRRSGGAVLATIKTHVLLDRLFSLTETRLWLPRSLFTALPCAEIALRRPDGRYGPRVYERVSAANFGTPPELLHRLSKGALYKMSPHNRQMKPGTFVVQVQRQMPKDCPEVGRAMVNPWVFSFDTGRALDLEDLKRFEEVMTGSEVDFHLDFPPADWLRVRLHARLQWLWEKENALPPLSRLMFSGKGEEWERTRAFLVLDSTEGAFDVQGRIGPCTDPAKIVGFEWKPSKRTESSGALNHWPVAEAKRVLGGFPPVKDGDSAPRTPPMVAEAGASSGQETLVQVFDRVFKGVRDRCVPCELTTLAKGLSALTEEERAAVESIGSGVGGDSVAFVARFVREYLMPRSRIWVNWPPPPEWLAERVPAAVTHWKKAKRFDPTQARRGEMPERRLTAWWLRLIVPGKEKVPEVWKVGSDLWKARFLATLFRGSEASRWADPLPRGRLGSDRLGDFLLGGGSGREDAVSGPWGRWPHVLDLCRASCCRSWGLRWWSSSEHFPGSEPFQYPSSLMG